MKLNESNETVEYAGHDIVNILKEIDYMLISLHRMGSYYADKGEESSQDYEKETTDFIDETMMCDRLAAIRAKLSEAFDSYLGDDDMDDLERACMDIDYWSSPGDRNKQRWVL